MNKCWKVKNLADNTAELILYGEIGDDYWSDITAEQFVRELRGVAGRSLTVRINSVGGSVFAAQAIYTALKNHNAPVTVRVDGLAASAATIILCAGAPVIMPANAMLFIHDPWTVNAGDADEMRKCADDLDKIKLSIVAAYQEKTGLDAERLAEIMRADTWLTAAEAVELGFADEIDSAQKVAATLTAGALDIAGQTFALTALSTLSAAQMAAILAPTETQNRAGVTAEPSEKETNNMTLDEFKAKHPDIYRAAFDEGQAAGASAERGRIKAIEELAPQGHAELIHQAKFETGASAEACALAMVKAEAAARVAAGAAILADGADLAATLANQGGEHLPGTDAQDQGKKARNQAAFKRGWKN